MDCKGDPWIIWIFRWVRQNTPFYYYYYSCTVILVIIIIVVSRPSKTRVTSLRMLKNAS